MILTNGTGPEPALFDDGKPKLGRQVPFALSETFAIASFIDTAVEANRTRRAKTYS